MEDDATVLSYLVGGFATSTYSNCILVYWGLFYSWVDCSTSTYGHVEVKRYEVGTVQRVSGNVNIQEGFRVQSMPARGRGSNLQSLG